MSMIGAVLGFLGLGAAARVKSKREAELEGLLAEGQRTIAILEREVARLTRVEMGQAARASARSRAEAAQRWQARFAAAERDFHLIPYINPSPASEEVRGGIERSAAQALERIQRLAAGLGDTNYALDRGTRSAEAEARVDELASEWMRCTCVPARGEALRIEPGAVPVWFGLDRDRA